MSLRYEIVELVVPELLVLGLSSARVQATDRGDRAHGWHDLTGAGDWA
jgi:hypothetical protein